MFFPLSLRVSSTLSAGGVLGQKLVFWRDDFSPEELRAGLDAYFVPDTAEAMET